MRTRTPYDTSSKTPVVVENGRRLIENCTDGRQADVWKQAKAQTNVSVIIGKPGGRYRDRAAVGLWVDADFTGDLSAFWRAVERIEAARP